MPGYRAADGLGEPEFGSLPGRCTLEDAEEYFCTRKESVHADNFTELFDGRKISKIAIGGQGLLMDIEGDFLQYVALK